MVCGKEYTCGRRKIAQLRVECKPRYKKRELAGRNHGMKSSGTGYPIGNPNAFSVPEICCCSGGIWIVVAENSRRIR